MTNTATALRPVDQLAHRPSAQTYQLDRTYRIEVAGKAEIVRVQVHRDSYKMQCWGNASVLSPERKWTTLAVADRDAVDALESPYASNVDIVAAAGPVADALLARVLLILGV